MASFLKNVEFTDVDHPYYACDAGALGTFTNDDLCFIFFIDFSQAVGITPNPLKKFWSCTRIILMPENGLSYVTGLRYALGHITLAVSLG